jgi:hypothetical protein
VPFEKPERPSNMLKKQDYCRKANFTSAQNRLPEEQTGAGFTFAPDVARDQEANVRTESPGTAKLAVLSAREAFRAQCCLSEVPALQAANSVQEVQIEKRHWNP